MFYSTRRIGVDQSSPDIYENVGVYWRMIMPPPILSPAIVDPRLPLAALGGDRLPDHVFREDVFDSVARIRRGRLYQRADQAQPSQQNVWRRVSGELTDGSYLKFLFVYDNYYLPADLHTPKLLALGSVESLWQVVARPERISTGEFLFVLKARYGLGVLPEVDPEKVPDAGRVKAIETLEALIDAAHRESPGSIIDRARDAAQWCLATWAADKFNDERLLREDLGSLIQKISKQQQMVALRAAEIVQRLHSRVKPNEQERFGFRPPMEDDAELTLKSVGFLLRELGWASN